MEYKKIIKRQTKVMIFVVLVSLFLIMGTSYAYFMKVDGNEKDQVITSGTLKIDYSNKNGYIDNNVYPNLVPMSNIEGLKQNGYDFSVKNTGSLPVSYQVYLYVNKADYNKDLNNNVISGELFEDLNSINYNIETNDIINNVIKTVGSNESKEENGILKYKIYEGNINDKNDIDRHSLKIWLDEGVDKIQIGKYIYLKIEVQGYVTGQENQ